MKRIAYILTTVFAMIMAMMFTAPAAQASTSRCGQAELCFFADPDFNGQKWYYMDDDMKKEQKLGVESWDFSKVTSSVVNKTPYYAHIWNANGEHRCLPPDYNFADVGDAFDDKITAIGLYLDWC